MTRSPWPILLLVALLAACAAPPAPPTVAPATPEAVAPSARPPATPPPAAAAPATPTMPGLTLPPLPNPRQPSLDLPLPAVWLVVGDAAVPGTRGGFSYTVDLGSGQINPVTADAGPPQAFPDLAQVALTPDSGALLVVGAPELDVVGGLEVTVLPWSPSGTSSPHLDQELAPLAEQPRSDVRTYALPALGGAGEEWLLAVSLSFTGDLQRQDYVSYYWLITPPRAAASRIFD